MRYLIALLVLAGLGWLYTHLDKTAASAGTVMAKAQEMARESGPEAAEIGYRIVADRFPFSTQAHTAREQLHILKAELLVEEADAASPGLFWGGGALRDRLWSKADPYVSASTVALVGLVLALHLLTMKGSRVRGLALLLLLALAAAWFATQTELGVATLTRADAQVSRQVYAFFPWGAAAATALVGLLMLIRRRPRIT